MNEYKKREKCAICDNEHLHTILTYGNSVPLAGNFPSESELNTEKTYPLNIQFCDKCSLVQTDSIIEPDVLFKDYRYMSSIGLSKHFTEVAKFLKEKFNLNEDSKVVELGSNDGVLLKPLQDLGLNPIGFEPAINIGKIAKEKGCNVINDYFSEENAIKYIGENTTDLFIANNSFAHIENVKGIVSGIHKILKKDGHFVFEVHYLKSLIQGMQVDNIYHEHIYYYSLTALHNLFKQFGMTIVSYEEIPIHAGSIRIIVKNNKEDLSPEIIEGLKIEHYLGIDQLKFFQNFAINIKETIIKIREELLLLKSLGYHIVGYGSSGRCNMLCSLSELTSNIIDYVVDESPERNGRFIAKSHIPIVSKEHLLNDPKKPDFILIFAWNFSKMIIDKLEGNDFKYIIPLPEFKIIKNSSELNNFISI